MKNFQKCIIIQYQHTFSKISTIGVHPLKQEMYKGEYLVTGCILPSPLWFNNNFTMSLLPISQALKKDENGVNKNYSHVRKDVVVDLQMILRKELVKKWFTQKAAYSIRLAPYLLWLRLRCLIRRSVTSAKMHLPPKLHLGGPHEQCTWTAPMHLENV